MANICFGCNEVENIEQCPNKECVHYSNRDRHLEMDTEVNEARTRTAQRKYADIFIYKSSGGMDHGLR